MKQKYLYSIGLLMLIVILFAACKKERTPTLIVHVQEKNGRPASAGAIVHAWYGQNAGQPGSVLNEPEMDQTLPTDILGDVTFNFKYSAVLDVDVIYYKEYLDSLLNPVTDTLYGHRVVKIESVRQKSTENIYRETVEVK